MSSFSKNNTKWDASFKKILKFCIIGLLLLGISCLLLNLIITSLDLEIFGTMLNIITGIYENLLNILIIFLLCFIAFLLLKFVYPKNKFLAYILFFIFFCLIITVSAGFYIFQIKNFSIFPIIGILFLNFVGSINNLLPFILTLPFLIIFYYLRVKTSSKFKLINLQVRNHILLIDDGKKKNFKAMIILQIKNIPKNIVVKENRTRKKYIEKLMIPGDFQYLHYHLTSLAKLIPNIAFEIRVSKNDIALRLFLSTTGSDVNEIMSEIEILKEVVITTFQTTFPGLKFEILEGNQLKNAWGDIFGGWGNYKIKFLDDGKILLDKIMEKTYLSIIKLNDIPIFKLINEKSQIDSLIRGLIGSQFELNYIISARPMEIYDFEKQKNEVEQKAQNFKREVWSNADSSNKKFKSITISPLKDQIQEDQIREDLINIRHAEITGIWIVSAYIVIRSNDRDKLNNDIQRINALISTIFNSELKLLESNELHRGLSSIPARYLLSKPLVLTSEQLTILFHLPENPIPSLSRIDIPEFEIPPERKIREGISIGSVLFYDQEMYPLRLTIEDLRLNTFICGLIGMGKTRLSMNILKQLTENFPDIDWLCLDWKGEYINLINEIKSEKIVILKPGSEIAPVKLNMFDPQRSNSDEHARKIFAIIREVFKSEFNRESELSSQMESVCKEVLRNVVKNPKMRNLESFIEELKNYARENQAKNRTIIMTVNALINRFDKFRHGVLKNVLDVKKSNINFEKLMGTKVIFDLNYLLSAGGTKDDVRFLMNIILKYVIDKALGRGITDTLKHIVVIEDSQLLIPSIFREVPETSLVEDIPLLLRGVGESLITIATRPEISSDIIANSGVKIAFKSPYDSQKIAKFQNLTEGQEKYLRIMLKREAIVTLANYQFPFRILTDYFEYKKISDQEIINSNLISSDIFQTEQQVGFNEELSEKVEENSQNYDQINENNYNSANFYLNSKKNFNKENLELDTNRANLKRKEDDKENYKQNSKSHIFFSKVQQILKLGPQNKRTLSKELLISKEELDSVLRSLLETNAIMSCIAPVFNKMTKQKLYFLPAYKNCVQKEIESKLEIDFLESAKIGKLTEEDTFNYIWYGNNCFLKIVIPEEENLNFGELSKSILNWFEEAIERGSFELIIIVPHYDWAETLRSWIKVINSNQIFIFSYFIEDWEKLREYLNNGINPEWNNGNLNNYKSYRSDEEGRRIQSNSNLLISPKINELKHVEDSSLDNQNEIISKQEIQKNWINEIKNKSKNKFNSKFLERFGENYPSIQELAGELGCTIQNVENEIKYIRKFLKSAEIHDLHDPINYRNQYYSWKNERLGQNLMFLEITKSLKEKRIRFEMLNVMDDIKTLIIRKKFLIFLIFEEPDLLEFIQISELEKILEKFDKIFLIVYKIELKHICENEIANKFKEKKIEINSYDWANLGPLFRKLSAKQI